MTNGKIEDELADELQEYKDTLRKNLLKFTRKAYEMLPKTERTCILDIGCGSGVPTVELARLSSGEVTGIDINQSQLDRLTNEIEELGLSHRIKVINCSMLELGFAEESFDIIWAEGAIAVMGFERGIREWRRFLRDRGYLVIHDDLRGLKDKLEQIPRCGYELIGHFIIGEDTWWNEYYAPLAKKLDEIRSKHANKKKISKLLSSDQREVDGYKTDSELYRSVLFVLRKT